MALIECSKKSASKEFIIILWNYANAYGCRWFFLDQNGTITLVNDTTPAGSGSNTYTYTLSDGSTLQVQMSFSSSYWHPTFTSSKKRKIKINLEYDGTGPTEYTLNANTAKTIDILGDTVFTSYSQYYHGGCGLIVEV